MTLLHSLFAQSLRRGTETYLTSSSPNYQESVFQMVSHTLSGDYDELNMIPAVKLMEVVLQNCPGKVSVLLCYVSNSVCNIRLIMVVCSAMCLARVLVMFSAVTNANGRQQMTVSLMLINHLPLLLPGSNHMLTH
jgi:hypothetical protein